MPITLEQFIVKAREKEESKVKLVVLKVEGFGDVEFQRPSESNILKFSNEMLTAAKGIDLKGAEKEKIKVENIDMALFAKAASEFVYNSCSFMRDEQIREMYKKSAFTDIPLYILGQSQVITLATELFETFNGKKTVEKIEEELKN